MQASFEMALAVGVALDGPVRPPSSPRASSGLYLEEPTLSPDGRALAYARWKGGASLWLLSLGSPQAAARDKP